MPSTPTTVAAKTDAEVPVERPFTVMSGVWQPACGLRSTYFAQDLCRAPNQPGRRPRTLRTLGGEPAGWFGSPPSGACGAASAVLSCCCCCCWWSAPVKGSLLCSPLSGELLLAPLMATGCLSFLRSKGKCCQPHCVLSLGLAVHAELGAGTSKAGAHTPLCCRLSSDCVSSS